MNSFNEKTISSEMVYRGGMVNLSVSQVELPNGKTSTREIIKHPGSVGVLAITDDNKILIVKQFRKPLERTILEIPAGKLEYGEDPEESAARELEEETGFKAGKLEHVASFYASPGYTDEYKHIYKATDLSAGQVNLDEDEFVELKKLTLEECLKAIESGDICDAKTVFAIHWWNRKTNGI